jgi:LacI family transcriptional regulator
MAHHIKAGLLYFATCLASPAPNVPRGELFSCEVKVQPTTARLQYCLIIFWLRAAGAVLYDNDIAGLEADQVFVNNREASMTAVQHLLDIGHRRAGIVTGELSDTAANGRYLGYCDALTERGLKVDPQFVVSGHWTMLGGTDATRRLMLLPKPPRAIFSANYVMALGASRYLKDIKIRIPDDVSIISFDDPPLFELYEQGITVVAQPINAVAQTIADVLERRLRSGEATPFGTADLHCNVIRRGSARPV